MDTDEDMEVDTAAASSETPKKGPGKDTAAASSEKKKPKAKAKAEGNAQMGRPKKGEAVDNANQTRIVNFLKYQSEKKKTADTCVHLPSLARLLVRRCTICF